MRSPVVITLCNVSIFEIDDSTYRPPMVATLVRNLPREILGADKHWMHLGSCNGFSYPGLPIGSWSKRSRKGEFTVPVVNSHTHTHGTEGSKGLSLYPERHYYCCEDGRQLQMYKTCNGGHIQYSQEKRRPVWRPNYVRWGGGAKPGCLSMKPAPRLWPWGIELNGYYCVLREKIAQSNGKVCFRVGGFNVKSMTLLKESKLSLVNMNRLVQDTLS